MAEPLRPVVGEQPTSPRRRLRLRARLAAARSRLVAPARLLPGLAAAGCAFAGAWLLWSLGVALLVAAGLLLLVDARLPGLEPVAPAVRLDPRERAR